MVGGSRGALPLPLRGDGVVPSGSSGQSVRRRCSARRGRPLLPGASRLWAAARRGMGSFPGGDPPLHGELKARRGGGLQGILSHCTGAPPSDANEGKRNPARGPLVKIAHNAVS